MAQPVWITPAGSLGTIPEGVFYSVPLLAEDPDNTDTVYYQLVAGNLPPGIAINETGILTGIPAATAAVEGVPLDVIIDTTSKFAIRAYTTKTVNGITIINRLADRTFTITVTGPGAPEFTTPPGTVATYYDGSQITGLQIGYTESNLPTTRVRLKAGQLPTGLSISSKGVISGFIQPLTTTGATQGFSCDGQGFDQYGFDFANRSVNYTYEFVLEVSNGQQSNLRAFSITVYSRNDLTADTTYITADNTFITADGTPVRAPIILTPQGSLGTVRSDNFYAFQFQAIDLDGDQFSYQLTLGEGVGFDSGEYEGAAGSFDHEGFDRAPYTLPPGLTLDPKTGWLYGYIPDLGLTENYYQFAVRVYKDTNPTVISNYYYYNMTIVGAIDTAITWLTPGDLGPINNGDISQFAVEAINTLGIALEYQLLSGSTSSLPQGLELLPSGDIVGRVSFDTFAVDGGYTTFDINNNNTNRTPTTFDMTYTFTVQATGQSGAGTISVSKTFTIEVVRKYNQPYNNLYIQAMPPQNDRVLVQSLLQNNTIIPPSMLYRRDDPWFGRATNVVYQHAYGLTAATYADYVSSLYKNHYWKNLVLGEIKTAQATDDAGNVIYEVVYSEVIDDLVNSQGQSVSKEVVLPYPVNANTLEEIDTVWPNSLVDMRDQVIDTVGQVSNLLPRWMLSKQANGQVLGFTPAWVICYTKPGYSGQIAYNIQTQFGTQLNLVDFKVDRYELDCSLTKNWDPTAIDQYHPNGSWIPTPAETTTFDLVPGPETVFDGNSVKFIVPVDMYGPSQAYDKYLVFPYTNILHPVVSGPGGQIVPWTNDTGNIIPWINNSGNAVSWINSL